MGEMLKFVGLSVHKQSSKGKMKTCGRCTSNTAPNKESLIGTFREAEDRFDHARLSGRHAPMAGMTDTAFRVSSSGRVDARSS